MDTKPYGKTLMARRGELIGTMQVGTGIGIEMSVKTPKLPQEMIEEILTWVPTKPLIRFRAVSKHFCTLTTTDSLFMKRHLSRTTQSDSDQSLILQTDQFPNKFYYIPNGAFENAVQIDSSYIKGFAYMVGSANGLVCLSDDRYGNSGISLWNPATREYKKLRSLPTQPFKLHVDVSPVVAFLPLTKEYKVVQLVQNYKNQGGNIMLELEANVYSVRTNSWKRLGAFPYAINEEFCRATLNGSIHWIAQHAQFRLGFPKSFILSFDVNDEVFREVPLPQIMSSYHYRSLHLGVFRGRLCVYCREHKPVFDVWLMTEYNVGESWTKAFSVIESWPRVACCQVPVFFLPNDELLFIKSPNRLVAYKSTGEKLKDIQILAHPNRPFLDVIPYGETLFPIMAHDEVDEGVINHPAENEKPSGSGKHKRKKGSNEKLLI